ncbi:PREDICTED: uncharacterized protein LOC104605153 [Nelumbo nucifera]|uniref:Uncharacterized protein LOC104605153 n=1 Tax=Nelumbo nucifera TaxID=4432 RepID=A0A1U8AL86_NELNU|nr:PREDICTED: uncharacterized protein LOC104605153 [Nelumbo nucifera]
MRWEIELNAPASMEEFLNQAAKFMKVEEALRSQLEMSGKRKRIEEESGSSKQCRKSKSPRRSRSPRNRRKAAGLRDDVHTPPVHNRNYTALNAKRGEILMQIKMAEYVRWPPLMRGDPANKNPNMYCHFRRDIGHDTKNCLNLKDEVEKLIRRGYLKQFIKREDRG